MRRYTAARVATAVAVPIALLLAGIAGALTAQAAPGGPNGAEIYARLEAAANAGNPGAQRALAEVKAFVARTGADLNAVVEIAGEERHGGRTIVAQGIAPLFLNLSETAFLKTKAKVDMYRALRHAELAAQAKGDPSREITVSITAAGHRSIAQVLDVLSRNSLRPITLMVDVFENTPSGRVWKSRFTHAAADDIPDAFLAASATDVTAAVAALLAQAHADEADYDISKMEFEVYLVRAVGPASGADALTRDGVIFMVDSETAIADSYRNAAAHLRVIYVPRVPDEIRWGAGR
jgi:hypothetical protein